MARAGALFPTVVRVFSDSFLALLTGHTGLALPIGTRCSSRLPAGSAVRGFSP